MALALVIETLRPDWSADTIAKAITTDDRPWRTVVLATLRGATDLHPNGAPITRHPNGLRYLNPDDPTDVPRLPTAREALAATEDDNLCPQHGGILGRCPLCRTQERAS